MSENNNLIITKDLIKKYGEFVAVNKLNLNIKEGEIFGLLGPNGAGKSTIILMTLGLTEPTAGSVSVAGFNSTKEPLKVKRITGYLPEKIGFYEDLTAEQNLTYTARLNSIKSKTIPDKIDEALNTVGLSDNKKRLVKQFSKGMKQRLGIADVLIKDPKLVIFDEPTEGLDVKGANKILDTIIRLNKEKDITFMLSSHQLNLIQRICHRVGILSKGKLVGQGEVNELGGVLFGGGRFRIEVGIDEINDEIIQKINNVKSVVKIDKISDGIEIISNNDVRSEVSKLIANSGLVMNKMNMKDYGLEEVYLKYFKEEE